MTHLRVVNWILLFVPLRGVTTVRPAAGGISAECFSVPLRGVTFFTSSTRILI